MPGTEPTDMPDQIREAYGFAELYWASSPESDHVTIVAKRAERSECMAIAQADLARARDPADILWSRLDWASWKFTGIWPHRPDVDKLRHLLPEPFTRVGALL